MMPMKGALPISLILTTSMLSPAFGNIHYYLCLIRLGYSTLFTAQALSKSHGGNPKRDECVRIFQGVQKMA